MTQEEMSALGIPPHMRSKFHAKMHVCPRILEHEYGPEEYSQWVDWSNQKGRTHTQELCDCGFFVIWKLKKK